MGLSDAETQPPIEPHPFGYVHCGLETRDSQTGNDIAHATGRYSTVTWVYASVAVPSRSSTAKPTM